MVWVRVWDGEKDLKGLKVKYPKNAVESSAFPFHLVLWCVSVLMVSIGLHPNLVTNFHNELIKNNEHYVTNNTLSGTTL